MTAKKIDKFQGKWAFLSNFHQAAVKIGGVQYPTTEHYYQAMKTLDPEVQTKVRAASTAAASKKLGQHLTLRPDWEEVKVNVMRVALKAKFTQHEDLKKKLLETAGIELEEGNYWGDTFWGVCRGEGQNWLGKLLMELRDELGTTDLSLPG